MEIRKSIEALETLLARTDECIHTVTRTTQVPRGIDANVVHQYLLEQIQGEQASLTRTSPTVFELTITGRGNLGSVEATAEHVLELGIIEAKSKAWVAVQFSNLKDQTPDIGR